jgi:retron-type reverse transcriptase
VNQYSIVSFLEQGTWQGEVISWMLSNIYRYEVLDKWIMEVVRPRMRGMACLIRFVDDEVLVLSEERDTRRVMEVLPKRFIKYDLIVHHEKTKMILFEKSGFPSEGMGNISFNFLGFTHC